MDARQMREIPIADFLSAMGIQPKKQKGKTYFGTMPLTAQNGHPRSRSIRIKMYGSTLESAKGATSST